jgi:hypothetical protein
MSERLPRAYTVADMCNAIKLVAQWVSQQHPDRPLQVVGVSLSCEFVARVAQQSPGYFLIMLVLRGHMLLLQFSQEQHLLRFLVGNKQYERAFQKRQPTQCRR